jgi:hypothetical protein
MAVSHPASTSSWLEPLSRALDTSPAPVTFFFRDDDIGWGDDRLLALLDMFAHHSLPVDLAAIPAAISIDLARTLRAWTEATPALVAVHQHGFAHVNHEPEGRKCEFGPSRSAADQRHDIERGRRRLAEVFGPIVQPIFTPPWNRCTDVTGECLDELGFAILSRDATARPLTSAAPVELPIRVDWAAHHKGVRLDHPELVQLLIREIRVPGPVGVMFHHTLMDTVERAVASELVGVLASHPRVRCLPMMAIADEVAVATMAGAHDSGSGRCTGRGAAKESES